MKSNYRDFFALQLTFADKVAHILSCTLEEAILTHTNFHKAFNFGRAGTNPAAWKTYTNGLTTAASPLDWTCAFYAKLPDWEETERPFGCFDYEYKDEEEIIRIHFYSTPAFHVDGTPLSPLSQERQEARTAELRTMFQHISTAHPDAKFVTGHSWVYSLPSYCRLFPEQYIQSLTTATPTFDGTRRWGQFLRHTGAVKENLAADFLVKVAEAKTMEDIAAAFPYQELQAICPIRHFYTHFGISSE